MSTFYTSKVIDPDTNSFISEKTQEINNPKVTSVLLNSFYEHSELITKDYPVLKFWEIKTFLKEHRTLRLYCGRRAGHTYAGIEFCEQFNNPLILCKDKLSINSIREYLHTVKGTVIEYTELNNYVLNSTVKHDIIFVDTASIFSGNLEIIYEAANLIGNGKNTYIVLLG